jgi:hypothetical protein
LWSLLTQEVKSPELPLVLPASADGKPPYLHLSRIHPTIPSFPFNFDHSELVCVFSLVFRANCYSNVIAKIFLKILATVAYPCPPFHRSQGDVESVCAAPSALGK